MCSCSDTGNVQLPYNSPGGYLVYVLFSQYVCFPINGLGRPSGKPRYFSKKKKKNEMKDRSNFCFTNLIKTFGETEKKCGVSNVHASISEFLAKNLPRTFGLVLKNVQCTSCKRYKSLSVKRKRKPITSPSHVSGLRSMPLFCHQDANDVTRASFDKQFQIRSTDFWACTNFLNIFQTNTASIESNPPTVRNRRAYVPSICSVCCWLIRPLVGPH